MERRKDYGAPVDGWLAALPAEWKGVAVELLKIVRKAAPKAEEAIKWGMPVYSQNGLVCYLRDYTSYVTLGFYQAGTALPDPDGLLEGTGRDMRHVKVRSAKDIRPALFETWVRRAVEFNAR